MDNAPAHVHAQTYQLLVDANCRILFLPPHTTAHLQPLDVGVNGPFKNNCRSLWSEQQVALDGQKTTTKQDRIALCERVTGSFSAISMQTVKNAFVKCGL
jgi:hypothetical protein